MESKYYHLTGGTHSFLVLHDLLNPSEEFPIHTCLLYTSDAADE